MIKDRNNSFEVSSKLFLIYFAYAVFIWLTDAADLLCWLTGIQQCTIISKGLCVFLVGSLLFLTRKRVKFGNTAAKPDVIFCIGVMIIASVSIIKCIIPDTSGDVMNYHILAQVPGYKSFTSAKMFMPGDFQLYGFRWADRMYYPFRMVLGYRLGTIWGAFVNVVIFYQARCLLGKLFGEKLQEIREKSEKAFGQKYIPGILFRESTLAFIIVMTNDLVMQSGGYMVDCVTIPCLMETLYILLTKQEQNTIDETTWFALLCGCSVAMKLTNVVYAVPLIAAYLVRYRKKLSVGKIIIGVGVAVIPASIYMIFNYVDTGNPVFPYFNSIFKSTYWGTDNFKDLRWGPSSVIETILWPIMSVANPDNRTSEIPVCYTSGLIALVAVGLIQLIVWAVRKIKHIQGPHYQGALLAVAWISMYFWAISTGHVRYYIFGYMIYGILFVQFVVDSIYTSKLRAVLALALLPCVLGQPYAYISSTLAGKEWSWRESMNTQKIEANVPYLLNDKKGVLVDTDGETIQIDAVVLNYTANGSLSELLVPKDTPILFNTYMHKGLEGMDELAHQVDCYLSTGNAYDIVVPTNCDWNDYVNRLNEYRVRINDIIWPETFFCLEQTNGLIKLGKLDEDESNQLYYINEEPQGLSAPNKKIVFTGRIVLSQTRGWYKETKTVLAIYAHDTNRNDQVYFCDISEQMTLDICVELDLSLYDEDVQLEIRWQDNSGNLMDTQVYDCLLINPSIKEILE